MQRAECSAASAVLGAIGRQGNMSKEELIGAPAAECGTQQQEDARQDTLLELLYDDAQERGQRVAAAALKRGATALNVVDLVRSHAGEFAARHQAHDPSSHNVRNDQGFVELYDSLRAGALPPVFERGLRSLLEHAVKSGPLARGCLPSLCVDAALVLLSSRSRTVVTEFVGTVARDLVAWQAAIEYGADEEFHRDADALARIAGAGESFIQGVSALARKGAALPAHDGEPAAVKGRPTDRQLAIVADALECGDPGPNSGYLEEWEPAVEATRAWLRSLVPPTVVQGVETEQHG